MAKSLGNVVHKGQEVLSREAYSWPDGQDDAGFRRHARDIFDELLEQERDQVESGARSIRLVWSTDRVRDARSAFILSSTEFLKNLRQDAETGRQVRERSIRSGDGVFIGTPDLVLTTEDDAIIIDFKTGPLHHEHVQSRYRTQLHIYAYIWASVTGQWPSNGMLKNPITGAQSEIPIDPAKGRALAEEAKELIVAITREPAVGNLARPGEVCANCDYRPWCEPYWLSEHAAKDVTGKVVDSAITIDPLDGFSRGWITIASSDGNETLTVRTGPRSLADIDPGVMVRVMNPFRPPDSGTRLISGLSEVFVV